MAFTTTIQLGNAAMYSGSDVATALREVATRLDNGDSCGVVMDENGNTVGQWMLTLVDNEGELDQ